MPHYFFNIREGDELIADPDGSLLADAASAHAEAVKAARTLLAAAVQAGRLPLQHAIEILDEQGARIGVISYGESVGVRLAAETATLRAE